MTDVLERIQQLFAQGGVTMYPIVLLSLVSVAVSFERMVFWAKLCDHSLLSLLII